LTRISWLRGIWKGRSKGVSTVIGTVFLMLIIFMVSTNVLLWTFSQNALYTQAVKDENQKSADKLNENVIASNGNYSVLGNEVTVKAMLKNSGGIAAQIINLWVFDTNSSNLRYANKSLNFNLNPGDTLNLTGLSGVTVTIPGADPSHDFVSWFVTARGNTVAIEETQIQEEGVIVAEVAQGIGYLGMDFDRFRYFEYESADTLKDYPDGSGSYLVPSGEAIVFRVRLTNYDPSGNKRTLTLNSHSLLWVYFPKVGKQIHWHIVNVDETGTIQATYLEITIGYKETAYVYFASSSDGSFSGNPDKQKTGTVGPAAINLLLLGQIDSDFYGQNIPFVSVYSS